MEKRISKFLGVILVLIGAVLLSNSAGVTGFAILQNIGKTTGSIFGIVFVIVGVLLLQARESEEGKLENILKGLKETQRDIREDLRSGRVGTARELISYAKRLGLKVTEGGSHQYKIETPDRKYITTVPYHPGSMGKGLYRKILKTLHNYAASTVA